MQRGSATHSKEHPYLLFWVVSPSQPRPCMANAGIDQVESTASRASCFRDTHRYSLSSRWVPSRFHRYSTAVSSRWTQVVGGWVFAEASGRPCTRELGPILEPIWTKDLCVSVFVYFVLDCFSKRRCLDRAPGVYIIRLPIEREPAFIKT